MTATITASFLATLGVAGLVVWHGRQRAADRAQSRRREHVRIQAQLDRGRTYSIDRTTDVRYRELLALAETRAAMPYDQRTLMGASLLLAEVGVDVVALMEKPERAA